MLKYYGLRAYVKRSRSFAGRLALGGHAEKRALRTGHEARVRIVHARAA